MKERQDLFRKVMTIVPDKDKCIDFSINPIIEFRGGTIQITCWQRKLAEVVSNE